MRGRGDNPNLSGGRGGVKNPSPFRLFAFKMFTGFFCFGEAAKNNYNKSYCFETIFYQLYLGDGGQKINCAFEYNNNINTIQPSTDSSTVIPSDSPASEASLIFQSTPSISSEPVREKDVTKNIKGDFSM